MMSYSIEDVRTVCIVVCMQFKQDVHDNRYLHNPQKYSPADLIISSDKERKRRGLEMSTFIISPGAGRMSSSDHGFRTKNRGRNRTGIASSTHSTHRKIKYIPNSQRDDFDEVKQKNRGRGRSASTMMDDDNSSSSSESSFEHDRIKVPSKSSRAAQGKSPSKNRKGILGRLREVHERSQSPNRDSSTRKEKTKKDKKPRKEKKKQKDTTRSRSRSNHSGRDLGMSSGSLDFDEDSFAAEDVLGFSVRDEEMKTKKKKKDKKSKTKKKLKKQESRNTVLYDDDDAFMEDHVQSESPRGPRQDRDSPATPSQRGSKKNVLSRLARSLSPGSNRKKVMAKRAERSDSRRRDRDRTRSKSPGILRRVSSPVAASPSASGRDNMLRRLSLGNLGQLPLFDGNRSYHGRTSDRVSDDHESNPYTRSARACRAVDKIMKEDFDWDEDKEYSKEELEFLEHMCSEYENLEL